MLATALIAVELHELEEGSKYLISFNRKAGSNLAHQKMFDELHKEFTDTVGKEMDELEWYYTSLIYQWRINMSQWASNLFWK